MSEALSGLHARIRACRACAYGHAPDPVVEGAPGARVMLVGQAPGRTEQTTRRPWTGPAGRRLMKWMVEEVGFADEAAFRQHVYVTAVTRCYPGPARGGHGDARPTRTEVARCRGHLESEFALVRPEVTVLVGTLAIEALIGPARLDGLVGSVVAGHVGELETLFVPLPHPSGASTWLNAPAHKEQLATALERLSRLIRERGLAPLRPA